MTRTASKMTLEGASGTLIVGTLGIFVCNVNPFISAGPSRGDNLAVGLTTGRLPRRRVRDQLTVEVEVGVDGRYTIAGEPAGCTTAAEVETNVEALQWEVVEFFDTDCVGRAFDLTVEFPSGDKREGPAHLVQFGTWRRTNRTAQIPLLITVASGILVETGSS